MYFKFVYVENDICLNVKYIHVSVNIQALSNSFKIHFTLLTCIFKMYLYF